MHPAVSVAQHPATELSEQSEWIGQHSHVDVSLVLCRNCSALVKSYHVWCAVLPAAESVCPPSCWSRNTVRLLLCIVVAA